MSEATPKALPLESQRSGCLEPFSALSGLPSLARLEEDAPRLWLSPQVQRRVATAAGMAIAFTSVGTVADLVHQPHQYEGKFTLNAATIATSDTATVTPQVQDINSSLPVSGIDSETQTKILRSPRYIDPVVEQLKAADPTVSYASITENLEVRIDENRQVEVTYRDTDPQKVKQVLDQLAQSYITQSQDCQGSACRGIEFIESRLPGLQQKVQTLRQQIQTLNQQEGPQNLQMRVRLLTSRELEVSRQKAQLDSDLSHARLQYVDLQRRMALQPQETIAQNLLKRDARYQDLLSQFHQLNDRITQEFSQLDNGANLQPLYAQHQRLITQLQQEAGQVLLRFMSTPTPGLQDPIYQEPTYLQLVQQSIITTSTINLLEIRQQTLVSLQNRFSQVRNQLIVQMRQHAHLQNEFKLATQTLQQYLDELQTLKTQVPEQQLTWVVAAQPSLTTDPAGQPTSIQAAELPWEIGVGATVGIALGIGTAAMMDRHKGRLITSKPQSIWSLAENQPMPARDLELPQRSRFPSEISDLDSLNLREFPESMAIR